MAKYKQVEFAKLCGIPKSSLPVYIKRGKVIIEDGLIDEANPANMAFLVKAQEKAKLKPPVETTDAPVPTQGETKNNTPAKGKKGEKQGDPSYHQLEKEKKTLDIKKTQQEIELLEKRNMKMDGESIPTEVAKNIFSIYGKNMIVGFHNASKNWLTIISKMVNLSNAQIAEMDMELKKGANEAVLKAQAESKKALAGIIKEYSLKREVGEHD